MAELIGLGLKIKILEVKNYICWGTPNDYKTFIYWQSFFHKVSWHPYSLIKDTTVDSKKVNKLDILYRSFRQEY